MNNNTPYVTIPMSQYNQLVSRQNSFEEKIKGKFGYKYFDGWGIFELIVFDDKDGVIKHLTERVQEESQKRHKLESDYYTLKNKSFFKKLFNLK